MVLGAPGKACFVAFPSISGPRGRPRDGTCQLPPEGPRVVSWLGEREHSKNLRYLVLICFGWFLNLFKVVFYRNDRVFIWVF